MPSVATAQHIVGRGGERGEGSLPYEFGRPFEVDLQGTLAHALSRPQPGRRAPASCASSRPTSRSTRRKTAARAATVLLVDMSRSMLLRGCFLAAKKVAHRARHAHPLEATRTTSCTSIGFAYYARRSLRRPWPTCRGTATSTARTSSTACCSRAACSRRSHAANREIVVITDGEPTAHFENGQVEFSYPPTRQTLLETLREVSRVTRDGITINTFMLERSRALTEFVDRMTQHQPRPRLLRRRRSGWASSCWSTTSAGAIASSRDQRRVLASSTPLAQ